MDASPSNGSVGADVAFAAGLAFIIVGTVVMGLLTASDYPSCATGCRMKSPAHDVLAWLLMIAWGAATAAAAGVTAARAKRPSEAR